MRLFLILALALLSNFAFAQTLTTDPATPPRPATTPPPNSHPSTQTSQSSIDRLTESNLTLLDLLKKQQAVLEDIQFDRRLQSRQIQSLEERLQETLIENDKLQNKIDQLSAAAANPPPVAAPTVTGTTTAQAPPAAPTPPPPPASYLPAAQPEGMPGTPSWHRLFSLSGTDNKNTDLFQIQGHQWRVLWHNQDKEGKAYVNTSALFLNAFPKDDTVPQKVCSKLGSGGDTTQLVGPGDYYLKIEASGGSWELAVEDFH